MNYVAVVSSGSMRDDDATVKLPHRWTSAGVTVTTEFTGGHLLSLAVAGCVLNDVHREAQALGIAIAGVRVSAGGDFDGPPTRSTGITYVVDIDGPQGHDLAALLDRVDAVAEVPEAIRAGAAVTRVSR
ncbi:OsmC family protein [Demequina sp. NBRC 110053]|uniref:OsmC family protein n=1 Tax=Demequina sp. NBRC 110053 TaxID=1570342 RepID=UPI0009FE33DD|nr:OsmC family protein [Demequina sp. NBRC 110053]